MKQLLRAWLLEVGQGRRRPRRLRAPAHRHGRVAIVRMRLRTLVERRLPSPNFHLL